MIEWIVEINWNNKQGNFLEIVMEPSDNGIADDLEDEMLYKNPLGDLTGNQALMIEPEDFEEIYMWFYS